MALQTITTIGNLDDPGAFARIFFALFLRKKLTLQNFEIQELGENSNEFQSICTLWRHAWTFAFYWQDDHNEEMNTNFYSITEVAEMLKIDRDLVAYAIRSGQLRATNLGRGTVRPTWRIGDVDLDSWISLRASRPAPARPRGRPRKLPEPTQYF